MAITEKLVCTRADGGVSIMHLTDEGTKERAEADAQVQGFTAWRWMPAEAIPTDREFRDAWTDETEDLDININLTQAKDIQLERLRTKRNALLKDKYDVQMLLAIETADAVRQAEVITTKQQLRDSTEELKALTPTSIAEIKAATPSLEEF